MANGKITKRLVDSLIADAAKAGKTLYCWDEDLTGFGVLATKTGAASYFVEYRLGGRGTPNKRVSIGKHGALAPDGARKVAKERLGEVAKGRDVAQEKRDARHKLQTALSFAEVMELYLSQNGKENRSWPETRRLLEFDAGREWGSRAAASIATADVMRLIDQVQARAPVTAKALFAALRPLFAWAAPRGYIPANPLVGVKSPAPPKARDRVLSDAEIGAFWACCERMGYPFGPCFQLMLLTAQREDEVGGMEWAELDRALMFWRIPKARIKKDREHLVDISPQATRILNRQPRISCTNGHTFVFTTTGKSSISGWSKAKKRLDDLMRAELGGELWAKFQAAGGEYDSSDAPEDEARQRSDKIAQTLGFDGAEKLAHHVLKPWRLHDLRRTAATGMAGLGVPPQVVDRVLNHVSGSQGGLTGVYQKFEYQDERRDALLRWGVQLEQLLRTESAASNVVALRGNT